MHTLGHVASAPLSQTTCRAKCQQKRLFRSRISWRSAMTSLSSRVAVETAPPFLSLTRYPAEVWGVRARVCRSFGAVRRLTGCWQRQMRPEDRRPRSQSQSCTCNAHITSINSHAAIRKRTARSAGRLGSSRSVQSTSSGPRRLRLGLISVMKSPLIVA